MARKSFSSLLILFKKAVLDTVFFYFTLCNRLILSRVFYTYILMTSTCSPPCYVYYYVLNQIEYLGRVSTKRLSLADYHPISPGCQLPCLHNSRSGICHVLSEDPFVDHFKTVDSQRNHLPSSSGGSMAPMVGPKRVPMATLESHQSTRPRGDPPLRHC